MDKTEARQIASDWHGGQWSPLYALSSTGSIVEGLDSEVRSCIAMLNDSGQYSDEDKAVEGERLSELLEWAESFVPDDEPHDD